MKIIIALIHVIDSINIWIGKIFAFLVLLLLGVSMYEVIARYVFNRPTIWAAQILSILFVTMVVLGGGYVLLHNGHVRMDVFYSRLSPRQQAIIDVSTFIVFLLFTGMLAWKTIDMAWASVKIEEASWSAFKGPIYPKKIALALSVVLLLLQGVAQLIRNILFIRGWKVEGGKDGN